MALNSTLLTVRWDPLRGRIVRAAQRMWRALFGACPVRRSVLAALFAAAACIGVVALNAPPGPGLDPDSMSYLGAAGSLASHGSLRIPMADWSDPDSTTALRHFPPGYPTLLALPIALGAPPEQAARGVEAAAAFVTVFLAVWTVAAVAGTGAGAVAGAALLVTPALVLDHARVLSEPLCLALLAATLALMVFSKRPFWYGLTAAAAGLVRYAAVPFGGATVLWAFGLHGSLRERSRRALAPAILSAAVMLYSVLVPGSAVSPHFDLGPTLRELGDTLVAWLAPSAPAGIVGALLALVVAGAAAAVLRGALSSGAEPEQSPPLRSLLSAAGLLGTCYAAFVFVSRVLVYDNIPFDDRMLSPAILLAELATAAALGAAWRGWARRARVAGALAAAIWLAGSTWATVRSVRDARDGGWGYASDDWRDSGLAAWLRTEGRGVEIFSNDPAAVYFATHRPSRELPAELGPDVLRDFARVMGARPAVIVGFGSYYDRMTSPDSLAGKLGYRKVAEFEDGTVWAGGRLLLGH